MDNGLWLSAIHRGAGKEVKPVNTARVNATQLFGVALGLLVVVAGIIVNVKSFGTDIPLTKMALYAVLGFIVVLGMFILSRD